MPSRQIDALGKNYKISYEIRNPKFNDTILIIHGWGSNKEIMIKAFENHFSKLKQIYIDLPGMGASNMYEALDTQKYTKIVKAFLKELKIEPNIVMGHSFGGKISLLLKPDNLVLLSTAGIVEEKSLLVKVKIKTFKILKMIGLGRFYKFFASKDVDGMSREMYETLKNDVDEDFSFHFANSTSKTLIFWGENDKAVSLKSGEFIHKLIKNSQFYPLSGDHFFFLLHAKFIAQTIEKSFENLEKFTSKERDISAFDPLDEISEVGEVFERESVKSEISTLNDDSDISQEIDESLNFTNELKNSVKKAIANQIVIPKNKISDDIKPLKTEKKSSKDENLQKNYTDKNIINSNINLEKSSENIEEKNSINPQHEDKAQNITPKFEYTDADVGKVFEREYPPKDEPTNQIEENKEVDIRKFIYKEVSNGVYEKIYEDSKEYEELIKKTQEDSVLKNINENKDKEIFDDIELGGLFAQDTKSNIKTPQHEDMPLKPSDSENLAQDALIEEENNIYKDDESWMDKVFKVDDFDYDEFYESKFDDEESISNSDNTTKYDENDKDKQTIADDKEKVVKFSDIYKKRLAKIALEEIEENEEDDK
ncbi:MAG: alpha/beta fold hydrolase [Campylobacter sp.]|nr:alpha/beta fold hydrolase [Campylobacter sp.]